MRRLDEDTTELVADGIKLYVGEVSLVVYLVEDILLQLYQCVVNAVETGDQHVANPLVHDDGWGFSCSGGSWSCSGGEGRCRCCCVGGSRWGRLVHIHDVVDFLDDVAVTLLLHCDEDLEEEDDMRLGTVEAVGSRQQTYIEVLALRTGLTSGSNCRMASYSVMTRSIT